MQKLKTEQINWHPTPSFVLKQEVHITSPRVTSPNLHLMCLARTPHHKEGLLTQSDPLHGDQRAENRRSRQSRRTTAGHAGRGNARSVSDDALDMVGLRLMSTHFATPLYISKKQNTMTNFVNKKKGLKSSWRHLCTWDNESKALDGFLMCHFYLLTLTFSLSCHEPNEYVEMTTTQLA